LTSKGRKKRKKNSSPTEPRIKWTGKEEECLAEAWKTVSINGITGANQNFDTYWQRVKLAFDERKIADPYFNKTVMVRGEKAMATHWGIMQAACSRWHGIQEEIADRPVSGADFEAKVCLLAVSVDPGSPSFDSPACLCRCGGRSTCIATTPTARRSSTSTSSPASRPARSGRKYAGTSPRTRTRSTTPTLQPLPRRRAAPSSAKKAGHPADRLQASFDKCWADARAHATGRDTKYDARWKEMLANQGARITLLKTTSAAKKRNTDLAFLIGGNDAAMDEETRAWYNAHRQEILRPPSTASTSPSTTSTPATDDASLPEAQEGTADEPVVV
jgi:hypothetical protein